MKNLPILTLLTLCLLPFATFAYEPLPPELDGTMMPYDFSACDTVTPWAGTDMQPIAVSYIARHGARYLSSEKKVEPLIKAVRKSRMAGTITSEGEAFASLLDTVCVLSDGRWGDLSSVGAAEQQRLGDEFCSQVRKLSEQIVGLAESSCVPRVVRTMWDFLYPIAARSENNTIATDEGPEFSPLVRFFETNPQYAAYIKDGVWKEVYDIFVTEHVSPEPARRLFGNIGNDDHLRKLTLDMYGVLQSFRCIDLPAPTTQWMSVPEYRACWEATNLKRYLTRSHSSLSDEAMIAVSPLLRTVVMRTDASLESAGLRRSSSPDTLSFKAQGTDLQSMNNNAPGLNANFWFGHAETLLPLVALMGLPDCVALPLDWNDLATQWKDYEITPMAANVLIVLLKAPGSSDVHTAVRLNGRWVVPVGGEGLTPTWESVRGHWLRRIDQLGDGVADNR